MARRSYAEGISVGQSGNHNLGIRQLPVNPGAFFAADAIVNDNLPWPVSIRDIRDSLGIDQLTVVNDFEAVAYATQFLGQADTTAVIESEAPPVEGPVLVMGPGTGLGSAVLLPGHPHATVLATEAGQIALAPGNERDLQAVPRFGHDTTGERILQRPRVSARSPLQALRICRTFLPEKGSAPLPGPLFSGLAMLQSSAPAPKRSSVRWVAATCSAMIRPRTTSSCAMLGAFGKRAACDGRYGMWMKPARRS